MANEVNKKVYQVYFVGQDYQPIQNAANSMKIMFSGKECFIDQDGNIRDEVCNMGSDQQVSREIIDYFLKEIAPYGYCKKDTFFINSGQGKSKKLYDNNFDEGYFCGVVGVIRKTIKICINEEEKVFDVTLQIKSRLDVDNNHKISKPFFLSTMLLRDKVKLSNNTIPNSEDEIFDYLLLFWFREQIKRATLKGYYKTYRRFEKNDDRVKGTLDIARHIRLNAGQKNGRIAYSYRENTINNYLNQLIVAAYYHLKNKYYDLVVDNFDNNIDLKNIIAYLENETEYSNTNTKNILKNNLKSISHPYYTEYEELRLICLKVLRDEGISIFDGETENNAEGILFYLPELWEKYLEDKLIKKALPEGVYGEAQYEVKNFGCINNDGGESFVQETYPDYVFFYEDEDKVKKPFMILDAKFKPKWESASNKGPLSDVMEDYNKCIRDMVAANSHATGVIFPTNHKYEQDELNKILCHSISAYNILDKFYTIPVSIPFVDESATYSDWRGLLNQRIGDEIEVMGNIIMAEMQRCNGEKIT